MILDQAWREAHARAGDAALEMAEQRMTQDVAMVGSAQTWAMIAQAHYAAANVRAKPAPQTGEWLSGRGV